MNKVADWRFKKENDQLSPQTRTPYVFHSFSYDCTYWTGLTRIKP